MRADPWRCKGPHDAVQRGVAFIPEERRSQGVVLHKSIGFNINLPHLQLLRPVKGLPLISMGRGAAQARSIVKRLTIKTQSVETPVGELKRRQPAKSSDRQVAHLPGAGADP